MAANDIKTDNDGNTLESGGDFILETDTIVPIVNRLLRNSKGSWKYDSHVGVGIQDHAGDANTEDNGKKLEDDIISGLALIGIQCRCTVWPTSKDSVAINIQIPTISGTENIAFQFTYLEGKTEYIDSLGAGSSYKTQPTSNKYDLRGD